MKAQRITAGLVIGLCFLAARQPLAEAGYTMNQTCEMLGTGFIGVPSDCKSYGYCSKGVLQGTSFCKGDFLYDVREGKCNYADLVRCATTTDDICANIKTPEFIINPTDCSSYCYCTNGVAQCGYCPTKQVFSTAQTSCIYQPDNFVCPADSICRLVENNKFVGDPSTCGGWVRCVDGTGTPSTCSRPGYGYNPTTGLCEPNYTSCNSPGTNPGTVTSGDVTLQANSLACKTGYTVPSGVQYIADGKTCYGYYVCESKVGPGGWGRCPFNTHFNPDLSSEVQTGTTKISVKGTCVTPYEYKCSLNRCGNTDMKWVANPGCKTYSSCQNQREMSTGTCAAVNKNFPYFNELGQGCVVDPPVYPICAATP